MRYILQSPWSYSLQTKPLIRKSLLAVRRAILPHKRKAASEQAADLLLKSPLFKQSEHIACYLAYRDEFDCLPIIQHIWRANKKCYLPVLSPVLHQTLLFSVYAKDDPLILNHHKIYEPSRVNPIASQELDLVIVPAVAFDQQGNRLGLGGGYYDRTFAFLRDKSNKSNKKIILMGLGYEAQFVKTLPHDPWDVPLDGVITEERVCFF